MITYEKLETIRYPLCSVTPVLWRCGELAGIHRVEISTQLGTVVMGG